MSRVLYRVISTDGLCHSFHCFSLIIPFMRVSREKHTDEMCNFYMMYYMEGEAEFLQCAGNVLPQEARSMPADSLVKLPPNPLLDDKASGHAHHHHVDKAPHDEGQCGVGALCICVIG